MIEPWLTDICRELHFEVVMDGDGYNIIDNREPNKFLYDRPLTFDDVYLKVRALNGYAA